MASKADRLRETVLNFNVGVLGHIDSGKTSLAKALSTIASTASFDKNPQSKERGITLDLGFSSFNIPFPDHLSGSNPGGYESVQFTLVDCPGHASLIRTIIGGAQIIDLMILVVDITKGMQTQTAECLVIGEITCEHMIVVLNKVDLLDPAKRDTQVAKMSKKILKTIENTQFASCPVVAVAARPGGPEGGPTDSAQGVDQLIKVLTDSVFVPKRTPEGPFIFSVDHCFPIRGQGTVMTGTVLSGSISLNDMIEIPMLKVNKKVKSMQMFHEPVSMAMQGDRVGICVTQFDPKQVERCLVCTPGHLPTLYAGVISVFKVTYHKSSIATGAKFHITIGHETLMAKVTFFGSQSSVFSFSEEYSYMEQLSGPQTDDVTPRPTNHFALLEFEHPVSCPAHSTVIGSRLDVDAHSNTCRIAFHGTLLQPIVERDFPQTMLPQLKVFKLKSREGVVERMHDDNSVIGKSLFKKETKMEAFIGLKVNLSTGEVGTIEGSFGTSGKFRVYIPDGLHADTKEMLSRRRGKGRGSDEATGEGSTAITITLNFKRFIFDPKKQMHQ